MKDEPEGGAVPLKMANVLGVFYVLVGGLFVACILALINVAVDVWSRCKEKEVWKCFSAPANAIDRHFGFVFLHSIFVPVLSHFLLTQ